MIIFGCMLAVGVKSDNDVFVDSLQLAQMNSISRNNNNNNNNKMMMMMTVMMLMSHSSTTKGQFCLVSVQ